MVLVHGFMGSGDTYAKHAQRFSSNGHCLSRIFAFDWNTFDQNLDSAPLLDAFIDEVLAETHAQQVDLAGHSAGGGLGYSYLMVPERAAKVAHYAHIGSFEYEQSAGVDGSVPTLNLTSEGDTVVDASGEIPGATNIRLKDEDHYAVATSAASFVAIYEHFSDGESPITTQILGETEISVAGKVISFGENVPMAGATIEIYEIDAPTGQHSSDTPMASAVTDSEGLWGPITVAANTIYDFKAISPDESEITPHYYLGPFERSNPFVYLRTLPTNLSLVGLLLGMVPFERDEAILIIFSNQRALVSGRDTLKIAGVELLTDEIAPPDDTILALFLYDENENQVGDQTTIDAFASIPFLNGVDSFYPLTDKAGISIEFNGDSLTVPAISSKTDGPVVIILD